MYSNSLWTWIKGNNTGNQRGTYGTQGVSNPSNNPGSRVGSASWLSNDGSFWMFGGAGFDKQGTNGMNYDFILYCLN